MNALPLLALTLMLIAPAAAGQGTLRVSASDSWAMPMLGYQNGKPINGIFHDIYQRIGEKVGREVELLTMPRQRLQQAVERGEIDVRCYVSPAWLTESHHRYIWSMPFMIQRDVLVARAPATLPVEPEQLSGQRIGTVLGFVYTSLQPLFDSGTLIREDARTQEQVLAMLRAGRLDYAVSNELTLNWSNRGQGPRLYEVAELDTDWVACLVRDDPEVPTMAILRALVQMRLAGEFEAILDRYR
ncbi:substrate-binding periplasmic protein [Stutzerimonas tarimensis]|uniref:Substrate-binding periplasmic protein n=1 Tax=Stutzerimonas tarimensis TaxID=1507735 RepID=A0ABV7TA46_9GAMM